jgi:NOL1/NOP2/sun family putative RNA methylase
MIRRYFDFLGSHETFKLLEANEKSLNPWIRVNSLKISPSNLTERLQKKGFVIQKSDLIPYALEIQKEPLNLGSLHEYLQGYYYIQQFASILPPEILRPTSQDTVIDMCASPGGKSTHLAQIMQNNGKLILIDRNAKRIPALKLNIRRMGVKNSIILNSDATDLPQLSVQADKILLDAPCTGEGLIIQDPSRKTSKTPKDIEKMAKLQKRLLTAGLQSLRKKGFLLYSTCSLAPEENELVINEVLNKFQNVKIVKNEFKFGTPGFKKVFGERLRPELKYAQRLFPHHHNTIGFFLCLLQKRA